MGKIIKGQSALRIVVNTFTNLADCLMAVIRYRKPNGVTGEFGAGVLDGEKGLLVHECIEGEIDVSGWWVFWAFVTFTDGRTAAGEAAKVYVWKVGSG